MKNMTLSQSNDTFETYEAIRSYIQSDLNSVDAVILSKVKEAVPLIYDIVKHLLSAGGKRLRPVLTLLAADLCRYEGKRHIQLAAAVEFIHSATLLHDDVVDESSMRRGIPTANRVWDNKAPILVGDFLFSQAFKLMVEDGSNRVLDVLSRASAIIAEGEVMQLMASNRLDTDESGYFAIIKAKTAALFSAATEVGAVVAGVSMEEEKALADYGLYLGMAFQLIDDALDYAASQQDLGKDIGDDFREGKVTLPIIYCYQQADAPERAFWQRVIEEKSQNDSDFAVALQYIHSHNALAYVQSAALKYVQKALDTLQIFVDSQAKNRLLSVAQFAGNRVF